MRKTVDIITIVSRANGMLAAPSPTPEERYAVANFVAGLLHDADAYAGFAYVLPGGERATTEDVQSGNYDDSRRRYIVHRSLR